MKTYSIQSGQLTLTATTDGGLLYAVRNAQGQELLWDGQEAIWPGRAPVCFPWCGAVQDNWYEAEGVRHETGGKHGFVRDYPHELVSQSGDAMKFRFRWAGGEPWPWAFTFETVHRVKGDRAYTVCAAVNNSDRPMPVQLGFHPAFRCPFVEGSRLEDYVVRFENGTVVPMEEHLFDNDSISYGEVGKWARLEHVPSGKYIQVTTGGWFTTLLWSKPGIPGYVCIEPWTGYTSESHDLAERPGTELLLPGERRTWTLEMDFQV